MKGFVAHLAMAWRLHWRNRMALAYGYVFPLMYLGVFWVLYRDEAVPLRRHLGELLTVTILGGACFGLPTTLVSEREQGVWRRYRLTPVPLAQLLAGTVVARFGLIVSAGLLQLAAAFALGMTWPAHPVALAAAFAVAALAFIGLGLLLAMLADTVPAVQALGQCVFLPMLVIGGVAVPLASLPDWAQHLANLFPGRHAVEAMQAAETGADLSALRFQLPVLAVTSLAATLAAMKLFRWDLGQRFAARRGKGWLALILAVWLAVGMVAGWRDRAAATAAAAVAPVPVPVDPLSPWKNLTAKDIATLDFKVPGDDGVVAPFAPEDEGPDASLVTPLQKLRDLLPVWEPGARGDALQRVRNLLCVAAVADILEHPGERHIPVAVLAHLRAVFPKDQLIRMLAWIALHPDDGTVLRDVGELGVDGVADDPQLVRERSKYYAIKCLARLTGRQAP
jgi:ABC-2 type transport system permease protein